MSSPTPTIGTSSSQEGRRQRLRSQTGCITCRLRRVKCDEEKPFCRRCRAAGRTCDGYTSAPQSRRELMMLRDQQQASLIGHTPSPTIIGGENDEIRNFAYFVHRLLAEGRHAVDRRFWDSLVLTLAPSEPAVKHAVLALSLQHQGLACADDQKDLQATYSTLARREYDSAINNAHPLLAQRDGGAIIKVLVLCVLFVIFENYEGNYPGAQIHLQTGLKLVAQYQRGQITIDPPNEGAMAAIIQALDILDFQAMLFADDSAPYPYDSSPFVPRNSTPFPPQHPNSFVDLDDASAYLVQLARFYFGLIRIYTAGSISVNNFERLETDCIRYLNAYIHQLQELERHLQSMQPTALAPDVRATFIILRAVYLTLSIFQNADCYGPEVRFDKFLPGFRQIVDLAEDLNALEDAELRPSYGLRRNSDPDSFPRIPVVFNFCIGITIPLYITSVKCRDPALRRRALELLRAKHRVEGAWHSIRNAAVSEHVMRMEEEDTLRTGHSITNVTSIPEESRISMVNSRFNLSSHSADLKCMRRRVSGGWEFVNGVVYF